MGGGDGPKVPVLLPVRSPLRYIGQACGWEERPALSATYFLCTLNSIRGSCRASGAPSTSAASQ
jgi:hypothetical protein